MLFVKLSSHKKVSAGAGCGSPQKILAGTTLQKGLEECSEKEQRSFSCPRQQKDNFAVCVSAGLGCGSPQGGLPGGFCGKDDGPLYPRFTRWGLFFFCLKSVVSAS